MTIAALVALTFPACSDDGSSTACAHPAAGPEIPDTTLTTTDGGSTSNDTEDNATDDVTDSTSSPTTGGPVDPEHCVPAENSGITCEAGHRIWCGEVDALALEHLPPTYAEIVSDMCDRGDPPCLVCWNLANYC
ncbi:MAG TPA: hypothetical protein VIK91_03315, partial [Nannocystis sp.]